MKREGSFSIRATAGTNDRKRRGSLSDHVDLVRAASAAAAGTGDDASDESSEIDPSDEEDAYSPPGILSRAAAQHSPITMPRTSIQPRPQADAAPRDAPWALFPGDGGAGNAAGGSTAGNPAGSAAGITAGNIVTSTVDDPTALFPNPHSGWQWGEPAPLPFVEVEIPAHEELPAMTFVGPAGGPGGPGGLNGLDGRAVVGAGVSGAAGGGRALGGGGRVLLIFPGGGYRKVESEKEGRVPARIFAARGIACFVVHYKLGEKKLLQIRSSNVEPSIEDARAALLYVREYCRASQEAGPRDEARFGVLDVARIGVMGFSAGGHLALCLLEQDGKGSAGEGKGKGGDGQGNGRDGEGKGGDGEGTGLARAEWPKVAASLLVYPTLRSPTCWCVVGGLWIFPESVGGKWAHGGQHKYCFGSLPALARLVAALPRRVMTVTVQGDLLLPRSKHADKLTGAIREAEMPGGVGGGGGGVGREVKTVHGGDMTSMHGCGVQAFWMTEALEWVAESL